MRASYAKALIQAREADEDIFVLDADCSTSTRTSWFAERFPGSFANVGIAEQNMVGVAAGLASVGFRPVVNSFAAMMVHRAHEQLMQSIALVGADVVIAGHYAGLSAGTEGAPHHAIADVALMRVIPGMSVWTPCDDDDSASITLRLLSPGRRGPAYLRLSRNPIATLPPPTRAADTVRLWGGKAETVLVAAGALVSECLAVAAQMPDACVLGLTRLQPLERGLLDEVLGAARRVVTVEEHAVVGGLASALVDEAVVDPRSLVRCAVEGFTQTGSHRELLEHYGLSAHRIHRRILGECARTAREPGSLLPMERTQ